MKCTRSLELQCTDYDLKWTYCSGNLGEIWPQRINTTLRQGTIIQSQLHVIGIQKMHNLASLPDLATLQVTNTSGNKDSRVHMNGWQE